MKLWIRYREAQNLEYDQCIDVHSEEEWRNHIHNPSIVSSILWPDEPMFKIHGNYLIRRHPHERGYANNLEINQSYKEAAYNLSMQIQQVITGKKVLVYAPLRGALPIWNAVRQFLDEKDLTVYFPVTSSFVFYPKEFRIFNNKGRNASGRFNHVIELKRIRKFFDQYECLLYIDEIVSGGMMWGYLKNMRDMGIFERIPVYAAGIADSYGTRSSLNRNKINRLVEESGLQNFFWTGCQSLITEDQKFLLGIHYADYSSGLHIIPVLNDNLTDFEEKRLFDEFVFPPS